MKIDTSQIRSLETIKKPDGGYIRRIRYVKNPSPAERMREETKRVTRNLWKSPVGRTVIIAITASVIFNLITRLAGL